jgi:TonB family protein
MKNHRLLSLVATVAMLSFARSLDGEVKVIANQSVRAGSISVAELKRVYLEQTRLLGDGSHVEPVLEKGGSAHDTFLRDFLEINDDALQSYYRTLVFTGKGSMPRALESDSDVVAYVTKTRGAIGYVNATAQVDGVKVLPIVAEGQQAQRTLVTRVEPQYPETLKQHLIGGTVRLAVTVAPSGRVENVKQLGGNPVLVEAAITAVKQWVYAPGSSRSRLQVTIPFDPRQ